MSDDLVSRLKANAACDVMIAPRVLLNEAATALTEARAEIERLRATPPLLDAQSLPGVDALVKTLEAQLDEALRSCLAEREGRLKAESELSTLRARASELASENTNLRNDLVQRGMAEDSLRARVREVVGPFGNLAQRYDDTVSDGWIPWTEFITDHEWPSEIDCRAARQLNEDLK